MIREGHQKDSCGELEYSTPPLPCVWTALPLTGRVAPTLPGVRSEVLAMAATYSLLSTERARGGEGETNKRLGIKVP